MTELATPLLKQYNRIKAQYPDCILLYRLGDFYETFNEDAKTASRVLNIVLTRKRISKSQNVPLAGIPYHALDSYLAKLIKAGYRVAICEQTEDPRQAKGLVKRDVIRVVTPGTALEESILEDKTNNYLAAVFEEKHRCGIALVDLSTGEFSITEFGEPRGREELLSEICRLQPSEILVREDFEVALRDRLDPSLKVTVTKLPKDYFTYATGRERLLRQLGVHSLDGYGAQDYTASVAAAGAVLQYLEDTQKTVLGHINSLRVYSPTDYMVLDYATQRGLELLQNLQGSGREGTLLSILDHTITSMGGRLLKKWLVQPLRERDAIEERLEAVEELLGNFVLRKSLEEHLKGIYDIERIISRVSCALATPRDLASLKSSLQKLPGLISLLQDSTSNLLTRLLGELNPLSELRERLERMLVELPPVSYREGWVIKDGCNAELDELRLITRDTKKWLNQLRDKEAERTGVANLRIGFNKVFGYYIEITRASLRGVELPPDYVRKQTLVNAERFITPELKEREETILGAEEKMIELEAQLFLDLRQFVASFTREIQSTAQVVAVLDCLYSFAEAALAGNYSRPTITDGEEIRIVEGRHPVLEVCNLGHPFIPNDTLLTNDDHQIVIITGPNMAGKSTYVRQVALITLMAHMGSFVPAKEAAVCTVDRIFTRIGATDYLARGQSTFLVEMNETANILNNATSRSLVILDEIGRGTSTYDGLSIAWSVIEYLHGHPGRNPKTLFATHYHELVDLEQVLPRVKNYNVAVLEEKDKITFLYKIVPGGTDRSYGIYAATLAGVPEEAVRRAREILSDLESGNVIKVESTRRRRALVASARGEPIQLSIFDGIPHPVLEKLRSLHIETISPLEALRILQDLIKESKK
jgi:DNA mismatch repair protein MutS